MIQAGLFIQSVICSKFELFYSLATTKLGQTQSFSFLSISCTMDKYMTAGKCNEINLVVRKKVELEREKRERCKERREKKREE